MWQKWHISGMLVPRKDILWKLFDLSQEGRAIISILGNTFDFCKIVLEYEVVLY